MVDRMRFGGLASGVDTQSMVQQLMQVERLRMNRFVKQEKRTEWRQEAIHNMNRQMANFVLDMRKSFGLNQVSYSGQFRATSVNQFDWVKAASSSNETAVTARATAGAMNGTHTVEVENLAKVASATSEDLKAATLEGTEEGTKILNEGTNTFSTAAVGKKISFKLGGSEEVHTFTIGNNSTVGDLVSFIRKASSEGEATALNAAYDTELGQIMVTSRQTGKEQSFTFVETPDANDPGNRDANDITAIIFGAEHTGSIGEDHTGNKKTGEDAKIKFNGQEIKKATNDFSVYGINLSLKGMTEGTEVTLNVSTDVNSVVDKIKEFVDNYNTMIDNLNGKLTETFYKDYEPLTNEEKEAMSDRDAEQWEERSKSGLLRNDETITRMMQQMRSGMYAQVEGATGSYNQITQIGITTGNFRDGGKLVIDEEKLRAAISNDVDGVMSLMFNVSDSTDDTTRANENGLIQRLNDNIVTGMKEMVSKGGTGEDSSLYRSVQGNMLVDFVTRQSSISLLQRDRTSLNQRIAREEGLLARKEQSYWDRFTAMEKAMQEMNSQADWLGAQLSQW